MEAMWNLDEKWKLSTTEATLLYVFFALSLVGVCTTAILINSKKRVKNKNVKRIQEKQIVNEEAVGFADDVVVDVDPRWWPDQSSPGGWGWTKKTLMSGVCWSGATKWKETENGSWKPTAPPLLPVETAAGCPSSNSVPPMWQRPILMGEKCELPRFSGLILYDEKGRSLREDHNNKTTLHLEKPEAAVATLRDLLQCPFSACHCSHCPSK